MRLGFLGFGYIAQALANHLPTGSGQFFGTTRDKMKSCGTHTDKVRLLEFNLNSIDFILKHCDTILVSTPPDRNGDDPVLKIAYQSFIKYQAHCRWIGYLSATSVYGDHQGNWVTEQSAPNQPSITGQKRLSAEQGWLSLYHQNNLPIHVFRLAGIYGPGRSRLDKMETLKDSIYKPNHCFSRIHVHDICRFLTASIQQPTSGEIFNLSDDLPAPSHEVDAYAACLLNVPPPNLVPYEQANLSPIGLEFYQSHKRVSNDKVKKMFNMALKFPTYQEGLRAILKD